MPEDPLSHYAPANDAERATLEEHWAGGRLQERLTRVLEFVERHREEIRWRASAATAAPDPLAFVETVKRLIIEAGSVHHRSEMHDQVRAIHDEIWIRGERGDYDREFITRNWTSRHAAAWRHWRLKEYVFVANHAVGAITETVRG